MYKDNIDQYLKDLAKEFRRLNGKVIPAEIIIVGGASIVINYGFRDGTADIDAVTRASGAMQDAARIIRDRYGLDDDWFNDNFKKTSSYSSELFRCSKYYKTYSGIVRIYTVSGKYLIAMKLKSGRNYKYDKSDIIGILNEHRTRGDDISLDDIISAVTELYGSYDAISEESKLFIEKIFLYNDFDDLYNINRADEIQNKKIQL